MEINDDYILHKYWKGKQQVFVRYMKSNKCLPEEIQYIKNRYDSNSIEETLYRMKNHINVSPVCKICGKKLVWTAKHGYHTYCSKRCSSIDPVQVNKRQQGTIKKFGGKSSFLSKEIRKKRENTWKEKYGGHPFSSQVIKEKIKKTCLNRYGVEKIGLSKEIKEKIKETCLRKYGVDNYAKTDEFKIKLKETCFKKYGDYCCNLEYNEILAHSKEANDKRYMTMKKNNSWSTSKPEEDFYINLCNYFFKEDIERNYSKDDRYPFRCDFYVRPLDLFIECNFHWTHGGHPFNPNSIKDQVKLQRWKSKQAKYYNKAIETWTIRDVQKHKYVKNNNLNYVEFYNELEVYNFYIQLDKIFNKMNKDFEFEEIESIECLGPCEDDYVYDIEVDDNTHTFIADNILVHNSVYTSYGDFFRCWTEEALKTVPNRDSKINWILKFNTEFLDKQNTEWMDEMYNPRHAKSVHAFELETVSEATIVLKKKKYLKAMSYSKGKWFTPSKITGVGVELIKSTSPKLAKEIITDMTKSLVYECGQSDSQSYMLYFNNKLEQWKKKFWAAPLEDISQSIGIGAYKKYVIEDKEQIILAKKAPVSVKCAARFNYLAHKNNQDNKRMLSGKIKYYNIRLGTGKKSETDYFGYPAGELPSWAPPCDKATQWQKNVIEPLNRFLEAMNMPLVNGNGIMQFDLFG